MNKATEISMLVSEVQETEHQYLLHGPRHDPVVTPWMPYQPADFIGIVWECMPELSDDKFLDVGCGPGTKMQIAETLFGLDVYGIEINTEMAAVAAKLFGDKVAPGDAMTYSAVYSEADLLWLYRPFRDPTSEYKLEQKIIDAMKPGAILAGASWELDPAVLGWNPVVDDCLINPADGTQKIIRGAWQKPAADGSDTWPKIIKSGIFAPPWIADKSGIDHDDTTPADWGPQKPPE